MWWLFWFINYSFKNEWSNNLVRSRAKAYSDLRFWPSWLHNIQRGTSVYLWYCWIAELAGPDCPFDRTTLESPVAGCNALSSRLGLLLCGEPVCTGQCRSNCVSIRYFSPWCWHDNCRVLWPCRMQLQDDHVRYFLDAPYSGACWLDLVNCAGSLHLQKIRRICQVLMILLIK